MSKINSHMIGGIVGVIALFGAVAFVPGLVHADDSFTVFYGSRGFTSHSNGVFTVSVYGAGGGGGSGYKSGTHNASGFGGGGGGYAQKTITVKAGDRLGVVVGTGGAGAVTNSSVAGGGGATSVYLNNNFIFAAGGGGGGVSGVYNSSGAAGETGGGPGGGAGGYNGGPPGGGGGSGSGGDTNLTGGAGGPYGTDSSGNPRASGGGGAANGGQGGRGGSFGGNSGYAGAPGSGGGDGGASGWLGSTGDCPQGCGQGGNDSQPGSLPGGGGGGSDVGSGAAGANGQATITFTPTNQAPIGNLDGATCSSIGGWAYDPDAPSTSINVDVYSDGTSIGKFPANGSRPDVEQATGGGANSGFTVPTPASLQDGNTHTIRVYGIDTGDGSEHEISNSGQEIQCSPKNNPPTAPTVSGSTGGSPNQSSAFNIVSTDPDQGDTVEYFIDWEDGSGYQNYDGGTFHPSGQQVSVSKSWSATGNYAFKVKAQDNHGAQSSETSYPVKIASVSGPQVSLSSDRSTVNSTDSDKTVTLSWASSNADSCSASGDWSGAKQTSGSESVTIAKDSRFGIQCSGANGSAGDSVSVAYVNQQQSPGATVDVRVDSESEAVGSYDGVDTTASNSNGSLVKHGVEVCFAQDDCAASGGKGWQNVGENWSPSNPDRFRANPRFDNAGKYLVRAYAFDGATTVYSSDLTVAVGQGNNQDNPGDSAGNGGNNGGNGNGGSGGQSSQSPSFTISANPVALNIQFIGNVESATSAPSNITINPGPGFSDGSVLLTASSANLPPGTLYSFDGKNETSVNLTNAGCSGGNYCSANTGLIGTRFEIFAPKPLSKGVQYTVVITGTPSGGGQQPTTTLTVTPNALNPNFSEF